MRVPVFVGVCVVVVIMLMRGVGRRDLVAVCVVVVMLAEREDGRGWKVVESIRISAAGEWRMEELTEVGNIFKCAAFGDQCG